MKGNEMLEQDEVAKIATRFVIDYLAACECNGTEEAVPQLRRLMWKALLLMAIKAGYSEAAKAASNATEYFRDLQGASGIPSEVTNPKLEPLDIQWPEYHYQGMGCGLEDRGTTDRYEAARYGWDEALDAVAQMLPDKLYAQPQQTPLTDDEIDSILFIDNPRDFAQSLRDFARRVERRHRIGVDN